MASRLTRGRSSLLCCKRVPAPERLGKAPSRYERPDLLGTDGTIGFVKPLTLIGYWASKEEPEWPNPTDLVDPSWDADELSLVAGYLDRGMVPWIQLGISTCRLCGAENRCAEVTDGTYVWPEGLSHYVREHSVRLPSRVVGHILEQKDPLKSDPHEDSFWPDQVDSTWWRSIASRGKLGLSG